MSCLRVRKEHGLLQSTPCVEGGVGDVGGKDHRARSRAVTNTMLRSLIFALWTQRPPEKFWEWSHMNSACFRTMALMAL